MEMFLATKISTPIIGQVSSLMGWIMNGIYMVLNNLFGIQNLALCIIIFSIIIYLLMTPLQIQQQKFSKLSSIMNPELQAIQKKYQGKKDQDSLTRQNEETQAVYQKYGVSPTGSCLQLLIQFPVLMALWQVIYRIPAYVGGVKDVFADVVAKIVSVEGYTNILQTFMTDNRIQRVALTVLEDGTASSNSIVDCLYSLSPNQWTKLAEVAEFSGFSDTIGTASANISRMQNFFGLNIAEQPLNYITGIFAGGSILLAIVALLIPVLSWLTQRLNLMLMPQAQSSASGANDSVASSMKTMNNVMPIVSAVFCFTFPVGMGIYWVMSSVVRSIQQVVINKHLDKIDIDKLINANMDKIAKKREKEGLPASKITTQAHQNVRNINTVRVEKGSSGHTDENAGKIEQAYETSRKAAPGSITAKANMVRDFDERNKKK